jgi:cytoskeletal protein RodZ
LQGFGEKLRKQREQQGMTLEAISSTTKISTRMLRALEEERFEQLPGGVFNKGFVRAFARQVGLNEEESIADYLAALSESQIKSQTVPPDLRGKASGAPPRTSHRVPGESVPEVNSHDAPAGVVAEENRLTDRRHGHDRRTNDDQDRRIDARRDKDRNREDLASAEPAHSTEDSDARHREPWQIENRPAADLLSSVHQEENRNQARQSPMSTFTTGSFGEPGSANSSARIPWATLAAVLLIVCVGLAFWNIRRHHHALAAKPSAVTSPEVVPAQTSPAPELTISKLSSANRAKGKLESVTASGVSKPEKISAAPKPLAAVTKNSVPNNSVANSSAPNSSAPVSPMPPNAKAVPLSPVATTPAAFTLLIRADQTSWVSITADGKVVAEETLIAPAEKSVHASNQIIVKTGNAAGVSFLFNSKEIPPQGNNGEVRTYTFDASGMKASPGSPSAATPNN